MISKSQIGEKRIKKLHHLSFKALLISILMLFCLFSIGSAERGSSDSDRPLLQPTSDRLITIRLTMSNGQVIQVSQYDSKMIITGPVGGEKIGITPHILENSRVALDFSHVTKSIDGSESGRTIVSIGSMELNSALPRATPVSLISSIELIGISTMSEGAAVRVGFWQNTSSKQKHPPKLREECPCCVTCGGNQTCGVNVQMSCGSCNCD